MDVVSAYPPVGPYAFSGYLDLQDRSHVTLPTDGMSSSPADAAYYDGIALDHSGAASSDWRGILQSVEPGSPEVPFVVPPEEDEDPSCGGEGEA